MTFAFLPTSQNKRQSFYALPLVLCHYKNLLGILGGDFVGLAFAVQGFLQSVPGQHRAFYAGRHVGDAAWPGPVWGSGPAQPISSEELAERIGRWRQQLG